VCHDWEWPAPAFNYTTEFHRHPNWMYSHNQLVQVVKSSVWLWNLFTKDSITSAANWSLRLKLISIGLSFWFSRFCIVIPTMSLLVRFCNAWRNRSFRLARKWLTGSLASEGGRKRTTCCPPFGTETSILPCNCVLNLESASHGLQTKEYVLNHTENCLRYSTIKHHNMIITYQSSVALRNIVTMHH
jgi:hypothetical protein